MAIPFLNLKAQHQPLKQEILAAVSEVLDSTAFAGGHYVTKFEEEFAAYCQVKHAVGVGNGTDALWFALLALGIGHGDEVITVPNTFIATAEAITYCGAKPVFVDVDEETCTMNPALIEAAITPRTKAIIPVHLYGQMADMDPIMEIARKHKLFVIEDACQAHGAEYKGRRAGSIGDVGCFSFYPGKNLGACGEAGASVTNSLELKNRMAMFRDHGQAKKYYHNVVGWNGRMDGIQGAILSIKLKHLDAWTEARRTHAAAYNELLSHTHGVLTPKELAHNKHVYHLYVLRIKNRDQVLKALGEKGISCGIHYPVPLHLQEAYASLGLERGSFPVSERCSEEIISLPMFAELSKKDIQEVVRELTSLVQATPETAVA
ncbi:MAG: DegT/DnrJ/EryC1/StrS family aminotransferase [Verrucomicrobiota bacterium]